MTNCSRETNWKSAWPFGHFKMTWMTGNLNILSILLCEGNYLVLQGHHRRPATQLQLNCSLVRKMLVFKDITQCLWLHAEPPKQLTYVWVWTRTSAAFAVRLERPGAWSNTGPSQMTGIWELAVKSANISVLLRPRWWWCWTEAMDARPTNGRDSQASESAPFHQLALTQTKLSFGLGQKGASWLRKLPCWHIEMKKDTEIRD